MALVFFFSAQPQLPGAPSPMLSVAAHFAEYAILTLLLLRAVSQEGRGQPREAVLWALAIAGLYALSDEFHQAFVPGRTFDVWDLAWDLAGAGVAVVLWVWLKRGKPR